MAVFAIDEAVRMPEPRSDRECVVFLLGFHHWQFWSLRRLFRRFGWRHLSPNIRHPRLERRRRRHPRPRRHRSRACRPLWLRLGAKTCLWTSRRHLRPLRDRRWPGAVPQPGPIGPFCYPRRTGSVRLARRQMLKLHRLEAARSGLWPQTVGQCWTSTPSAQPTERPINGAKLSHGQRSQKDRTARPPEVRFHLLEHPKKLVLECDAENINGLNAST
jgi:hypothetical protein